MPNRFKRDVLAFVPVLDVVIVEWGRYKECATVWTIDTDKADF